MSIKILESIEEACAKTISDDLKFSCAAFRDSVKVTTITQREIRHRLKEIYSRTQQKNVDIKKLIEQVFENLLIRRIYPQLKISLIGKAMYKDEKIISVELTIVNKGNVEVI